ncbi:hypothetical protein ACLOJK_013439 [Asimina triloba]
MLLSSMNNEMDVTSQDDIVENNFNILRMFVGIYGASMAPKMLAKSITEAEDEYQHLLDALDPELSSKYKRRCQEAAKEDEGILFCRRANIDTSSG